MKRTSRKTHIALSALTVALLTACGGSGKTNFLSDQANNSNFGGGTFTNASGLAPINAAPSTVKKFLVDMKDEGQQTKNIVVSVDDDGNGRMSYGDAVRFNQPGVISEVCQACDGLEEQQKFYTDIVAKRQEANDKAQQALTAAKEALDKARQDPATTPTLLETLQNEYNLAVIRAAQTNNDLDRAKAFAELNSPKNDVIYMRDLNNRIHTIVYGNSIDHNKANLSTFLSHDVGVRKIDAERKIENGVAKLYNYGGSIGRQYNGIITFATPENALNDTGYVDAYLRDPSAAGLSYTTFGAFSSGFLRNTRDVNVGYQSVGKRVTDLPTGGNAKYTGIAHAYISDLAAERYSGESQNQVTMDVVVDADFGKRSLGFNTSNTYIHTYEGVNDQHVVQARPDLNLSGSAGWNAGSGDFKGSVSNAAGNLSGSLEGSFYGPAAAEVGGVFGLTGQDALDPNSIKHRVHYVGGFGAKRD